MQNYGQTFPIKSHHRDFHEHSQPKLKIYIKKKIKLIPRWQTPQFLDKRIVPPILQNTLLVNLQYFLYVFWLFFW